MKIELKGEAQSEIIIWDWLKNSSFKGKDIEQIYFQQKNLVSAPTFQVKGSNGEKPDMVLKINDGYYIKYAAVEVKHAKNKRNVINAQKILSKYYDGYIKDKSKYFINNKEIKIDYFLVATEFSKKGRLFEKEKIESNSKGREGDGWTNIIVPRLEYNNSKYFTRQIFSTADDYRKKTGLDKKGGPGIGVLYSDVLLNFNKTELELQDGMMGKPIIFCVKWIDYIKKPEWKQRIIKL